MKKVLCSIFSVFILLFLMSFPITSLAEENINVYYEGELLVFDVEPQIINNFTMVPARTIFEAMGAKVKWDEEIQTVTVKKKKKSISMTIGGQITNQDGEVINTETVPVVLNDRTLVPVRLISEFLGAQVEWNENTNTIYITEKEEIEDDSWKENLGTINMTSMEVNGSGVKTDDKIVYITEGGDFEVSGKTEDGIIIVNTDEKVKLRLSGVDITNSDGPAIYFKNTDKGYITLTDGTDNTLTDSEQYNYEDASAPLFSDDNLEIKGNGSLIINANYKHGIAGDDDIRIENGNITINSKIGDGIHAKCGVKIIGGTLNITSDGDGIQSGEWNVIVDGGEINMTTTGEIIGSHKNITGFPNDFERNEPQDDGAKFDSNTLPENYRNNVNEKGGISQILNNIDTSVFDNMTVEEVTEKLKSMVENGELSISGNIEDTQQTQEEGVTTNEKSSKGLKAAEDIYINSGKINIHSIDHSIHSGDITEINGGELNIYSEEGKGMSAHGNLNVNAGDINIEYSTEGIESKAEMTINSGNIHIISTDDGLNAGGTGSDSMEHGVMDSSMILERLAERIVNGNIDNQQNNMPPDFSPGNTEQIMQQPDSLPPNGERPTDNGQNISSFNGQANFGGQRTDVDNNGHSITINGGYIYIDAMADAIDSNGFLEVNGGTIILDGPTSGGDSPLDTDGSMWINGGYIVAVGSNGMLEIPSDDSKQNVLVVSLSEAVQKETIINIKNSSGEDIITFKPSKEYQALIFSSPDLDSDDTYTISYGGTAESESIDGLYSQPSNYIGGTEIGSITTSETISKLGTFGGRFGGGRGGF